MIRCQFSLTIFTDFISILPIEFTMMHVSQLQFRLLNYISCRSLKIAWRFSIASNCYKNETKQKNTNQKQVRKKRREVKLDRTEKNQILNCLQY